MRSRLLNTVFIWIGYMTTTQAKYPPLCSVQASCLSSVLCEIYIHVLCKFHILKLFKTRKKCIHFALVVIIWSVLTFVIASYNCLDMTIKSHACGEDIPEETREVNYYNFSMQIKNQINDTFLGNNKHVCKKSNPDMIVIIPSRPESFQVREAIRVTYGSLSRDKTSEINGLKIEHIVRLMFIIGKSIDVSTENAVLSEMDLYNDIIKVDIKESMYNLTLKMVHGFKWISTYCSEAQFILKADEDVFVHIGGLLQRLKSQTFSNKGNIFGHIFDETKDRPVLRRRSKYAVPIEEFPLQRYPKYAQGSSYTLTSNLLHKIVNTAQFLPYLRIEDAFITGIIAAKIHGAKLVHLLGTSDGSSVITDPCEFVRTGRLAHHNMNPKLMYQTWNALQSYKTTCIKKSLIVNLLSVIKSLV